MKQITMYCAFDDEPRSPAVWAKVFPRVGEAGNTVQLRRVNSLEKLPAPFGDAHIIGAPYKRIAGHIVNFICRGAPYNTDKRALKRILPWMPKDARVLVLGAGCLGETLVDTLTDLGHTNVYCWNRTRDKAKNLLDAKMVPQEPDFTWFETVFNTIPYSPELNERWFWRMPTRLVNYVWGPDADTLSHWQAAEAMSLVWPEHNVTQFHQWITT